MLSPLVLVIFVISPEGPGAANRAIEQAALETLGPESSIRLETLTEPLSDASVLTRAGSADGVVEVIWSSHDDVALHSYARASGGWVDRSISFGPNDPDDERERLLGFAIATMFAAGWLGEPDAAGTLEAATASTSPTPAGTAPAIAPNAGERQSQRRTDTVAEAAFPIGTDVRTGSSLEFGLVVATDASAGTGPELGGNVRWLVPLSEPFALRVDLGGRIGEIPAAQATLRRVSAGIGIACHVLPHSPVEIDISADAIGGWLGVTHFSSDDTVPVNQHRWLAGGTLLTAVSHRFSPLAAVYAGAGLEMFLGPTHVYTHGSRAATIASLQGLGEAGFRTSF